MRAPRISLKAIRIKGFLLAHPIERMYDDGMDLAEIVSLDDLVDAVADADRQRTHVALSTAEQAALGAWAIDGWVSMSAWLQAHCRLSRGDAYRLLADGQFLRRFPEVARALLDGRLSWSQAAIVRRAVTRPFNELFGEQQAGVIESLEPLDLNATAAAMRHWRERAEAIVELPEPKVPDQSWTSSSLEDGTTIGRFVFCSLTAAELEAALETARTYGGDDDTRSHSERDADAMADILSFFNANHDRDGTPRHRPHVELNMEADDLTAPEAESEAQPADAETEPGPDQGRRPTSTTIAGRPLPHWATESLTCDCVMHRVLRRQSAVLDYGRATYSVPKNLFRAVACRDGGCRFPGCTRKVAWCDAHHIKWWRRYGATKLDNLVLLCAHHHRLVHRQLWEITLKADATAEFHHPDGRVRTSEPRGRPTIRPPIRD